MNIDIDLDVICTYKNKIEARLFHKPEQIIAFINKIEPISADEFKEIILRRTKTKWQKKLHSKDELILELYKYALSSPFSAS